MYGLVVPMKPRPIPLPDEVWDEVAVAASKEALSRSAWVRLAITEKLGRAPVVPFLREITPGVVYDPDLDSEPRSVKLDDEWLDDPKPCEHRWERGASGMVKCAKCGERKP